MIRIHLGNVGSGKTLSMVREMILNSHKTYYTNILMKQPHKHIRSIGFNEIINRDVVGQKRSGEEVVKYNLNVDYWKKQPKPLTVVLDEFHAFMNSRKSMSKINVVLSDFLSLIRRMTNSPLTEGELILITQFIGRIDVNAREMASQIRYFREHYQRFCKIHGILFNYKTFKFWENSDVPKDKKLDYCPICCSPTMKIYQSIEVWHFSGDSGISAEDNFYNWRYKGRKTYYAHYYIPDGCNYFDKYDTFQWDNMFSELYS